MKSLFGALLLLVSLPVPAQIVTCYNDDSLEAINRDDHSRAVFPFLPTRPSPVDCRQGPAVVAARGSVVADGQSIYDGFGSSDPAVEARVSPAGFIVVRTRLGRLHLASKSGASWNTQEWFNGYGGGVIAFSLSRTGNLLAARSDRTLIVGGHARFNGEQVMDFRAARNGTVVALLENGRIVDHHGTRLFQGNLSDEIVAVKISVQGTVYYVTQQGSLGSTKDHWIHRNLGQKVTSFKVSESDDVAYSTSIGRLYRNGQQLKLGTATVAAYDIAGNGTVTAIDSQGRAYTFR